MYITDNLNPEDKERHNIFQKRKDYNGLISQRALFIYLFQI